MINLRDIDLEYLADTQVPKIVCRFAFQIIFFSCYNLINDMKRVFRIENVDINVGFWYNSDRTPSNLAESLGTSNKDMPMPFDKQKYTSPSGEPYICSAPNLESLLHWFSKSDFDILIKNGFKLHMYEISEGISDGPQTLFCRSNVISDTILSDKAMYGVKQVIVVRKDLIKGERAVRRGKMMAQVAHASLGAYMSWQTKEQCITLPGGGLEEGQRYQRIHYEFMQGSPFDLWINGQFTKVVVSVENEEGLLNIYRQLSNEDIFPLGIPHALIQDSGFTEFHGVPTLTCLGIGPWFSEDIDKITSKLPLL